MAAKKEISPLWILAALGSVFAYKAWAIHEAKIRNDKRIIISQFNVALSQIVPRLTNAEVDTLYEFVRNYAPYSNIGLPVTLREQLRIVARKYNILPDFQ